MLLNISFCNWVNVIVSIEVLIGWIIFLLFKISTTEYESIIIIKVIFLEILRCTFSFEIRLEKYKKIISTPLIIIKNTIIENKNVFFSIDKFKQIINEYIINMRIKWVGWKLFHNIRDIIMIIIVYIKGTIKFNLFIDFVLVFSKNSLIRILILGIKGVIIIYFFD